MSEGVTTQSYICQSCGRSFTDFSDAILCCAPHAEGTVAVVNSEGTKYGC